VTEQRGKKKHRLAALLYCLCPAALRKALGALRPTRCWVLISNVPRRSKVKARVELGGWVFRGRVTEPAEGGVRASTLSFCAAWPQAESRASLLASPSLSLLLPPLSALLLQYARLLLLSGCGTIVVRVRLLAHSLARWSFHLLCHSRRRSSAGLSRSLFLRLARGCVGSARACSLKQRHTPPRVSRLRSVAPPRLRGRSAPLCTRGPRCARSLPPLLHRPLPHTRARLESSTPSTDRRCHARAARESSVTPRPTYSTQPIHPSILPAIHPSSSLPPRSSSSSCWRPLCSSLAFGRTNRAAACASHPAAAAASSASRARCVAPLPRLHLRPPRVLCASSSRLDCHCSVRYVHERACACACTCGSWSLLARGV